MAASLYFEFQTFECANPPWGSLNSEFRFYCPSKKIQILSFSSFKKEADRRMARSKQLAFFKKPALEYGGGLQLGRRKTYRPFDSKRPVHVVLRAGRAKGEWSLLHPRNKGAVDGIVRRYAARFRVRVMQFENVGNHLHLLVQASRREDFRSFMRTIPAQIATKITGARKGRALKPVPAAGASRRSGGGIRRGAIESQFESRSETNGNRPIISEKRKFWDGLAYSRIVQWGRDLLGLRHYLTKNALEGEGIELLTAAGIVKRFFVRNGRWIV